MFHKRLLSEFKDTKKKVVQMVFSQWIMLIANILFLFTIAGFIQLMVSGEDLREKRLALLVTLGIVVLIRSVMSLWNTKLSFEASKEVKKKLRTMVYEKLMRMGNQYKKYFQTSEIVQISTEGVEQLEIYFGKYVPQFFYSMLAPITLFLVVGTMSRHCTSRLCSFNSPFYCGSSEICKKNAGKILGNIHGDGRFFFGVSAGADYVENL